MSAGERKLDHMEWLFRGIIFGLAVIGMAALYSVVFHHAGWVVARQAAATLMIAFALWRLS